MKLAYPLSVITSLALVACASAGHPAKSESTAPASPWSVAGELQAYSRGVIGCAVGGHSLSARDLVTVRAGYQLVNRDEHGDGMNADEEGGGPGIGVGYHRYVAPRGEDGLLVGARVDLWWLDIRWEEKLLWGHGGRLPFSGPTGSTDVLVVQPMLEAGYAWHRARGQRLELTLGAGTQINAERDGREVGDGAVFLAGVRYWIGPRVP